MNYSLQSLTELAKNLRCLAMRVNPDPGTWARTIAARTGFSEERAAELILGKQPRPDEPAALADAFGIDASELLTVPLYEVLKENLNYLLKALRRGERKKIASALGITQSQLSRWVTTGVRPERTNLRKFVKYLGLDPDLDLNKEPLFLSMGPVGGYAQKEWLLKKIQAAPPDQIVRHFPTMEMIFRDAPH